MSAFEPCFIHKNTFVIIFTQYTMNNELPNFQMSTTAFAPDGSEALGRTLCSDRLRPDNREIVDFYQLDAVIDFLAGFEGTFCSVKL